MKPETRTHPYIAVEGVIGVGKTTLVRMLHRRWGGEMLLEAFEENPFLSSFYADRARYAFQTQIFFLLSRYRQQQQIPRLLRNGLVLADYFFAKDRLFARLNLRGDELTMYERLYEALAEKTMRPDLVVYLRASTDMLMARIAMRDRPYERQMDRGYIEALRQAYERFFADYEETPLLVIESDALDFVRSPEDLEAIEQRIEAALAGVRQPRLLPAPESTPAEATIAWQLTARAEESEGAQANWQALGDYLALAEAVGTIGGALARQQPIGEAGVPDALQTAIRRAHRALHRLGARLGLELEER